MYNRIITFNGQSRSAQEWASHIGITHQAMYYRLRHWPIEQALTIGKQLHNHRERKLCRPRQYTHSGKTLSLIGWADHLGISKQAMRIRLKTKDAAEAFLVKARPPEKAEQPGGGSNTFENAE